MDIVVSCGRPLIQNKKKTHYASGDQDLFFIISIQRILHFLVWLQYLISRIPPQVRSIQCSHNVVLVLCRYHAQWLDTACEIPTDEWYPYKATHPASIIFCNTFNLLRKYFCYIVRCALHVPYIDTLHCKLSGNEHACYKPGSRIMFQIAQTYATLSKSYCVQGTYSKESLIILQWGSPILSNPPMGLLRPAWAN